jgi:hypothetical protein
MPCATGLSRSRRAVSSLIGRRCRVLGGGVEGHADHPDFTLTAFRQARVVEPQAAGHAGFHLHLVEKFALDAAGAGGVVGQNPQQRTP